MTLSCRIFWLSLSWLLLVFIVIVSLIALPKGVALEFQYIDKVEHFISYFILMFLFAMCYSSKNSRRFYAIGFILLGIVIEILQGQTITRQFEYADMLANTLGIVFAVLFCDGVLRDLFLKFDNILNRLFNT